MSRSECMGGVLSDLQSVFVDKGCFLFKMALYPTTAAP